MIDLLGERERSTGYYMYNNMYMYRVI